MKTNPAPSPLNPPPQAANSTPPPGTRDVVERVDRQDDAAVVLALAREEVHVGKVEVETGTVVVRVVPKARTEQVDVELTEHHAAVERVPVNQFVTEIQPPRQEGDVMIVPVYEEVLVVERRLRLKEEVRVRVDRQTRRDVRAVEVREDEVRIERSEPPAAR